MADTTLLNQALLNGHYDGDPLELESNIVSTTLIHGLTAVKAADKGVWLSGDLTYTITVTNHADHSFTTPVFTDTLDITQIRLVANSVEINGTPTVYTYNAVTGLLTVTVPTIAANATVVISFKVEKV